MGWVLASVLQFSFAGEIRFDHLSLEDGLSQSQIPSILQDRVGFMWFGTRDGLNRYDGYNFVVHKSDPDDPTTISDDYITSLCEPRLGQSWEIWVGTRHGLNRFDPHTRRFTRYYHDPVDPESLSDNWINAVIEDSKGLLWIGTQHGLNLRLPPTQPDEFPRFIRYLNRGDDPRSLSRDRVIALAEDRTAEETVIWVGTAAGVNRLTIQSLEPGSVPEVEIARYPLEAPLGRQLASEAIGTLFQSRDGAFWLGTDEEDRFYRVEGFGGPARRYRAQFPGPIKSAYGITSFLEHEGRLWVGTFGYGINVLDLEDGSLELITHEESDQTTLSGNFVFSLHRDRAGRLWAGVSGVGLSTYLDRKRHFLQTTREPRNSNSLSHQSVLSVLEGLNGDIWVGTVGGLNRFDPDRGVVERFLHDASDPTSLPEDLVYALERVPGTNGQEIWVGTFAGLARLGVSTGRFATFKHDADDPRSLPHDRVQSILADSLGHTWIGTDGGVSRFDPAANSFENYAHDPKDPASIASNRVLRLFQDGRGQIWVATDAGFGRFDPESGRSVNYDKESSGLSDDLVYSFAETQDETGQVLWIGTRKGLTRFEVDRGRWTRYLEGDGLPSGVVIGVLPDSSGRLWLSTFRGLCLFDPRRETFRTFGPADGLLSYEFNWGAYHRGASGRLYFGGISGLNWFDPSRLAFNPTPPPVVLTSLQVFNREIELDRAVSTLREIELNHDQNSLSFEFAALDYTVPEQNRYAYFLEGVDPGWVESGNRRYVSYTELGPGQYRFWVKGSNNDGVWNDEGTVLHIRIHPPIWRTWPAYLLYAALIGGVAFLWERARSRRVRLAGQLQVKRLEAQKLAEVDRLKSRFFTDITHEFRTPLTLILGSLERLRAETEADTKDHGRIRRSAEKLRRLIDQMLDLARLDAGKVVLKPAVQDLSEFTRFAVSCFSSLAESRGVELISSVPSSAILANFDREELEKCFSNLLTNALKFTPRGGSVTVRLRRRAYATENFPHGCAVVEVEDTGVGIPQEELERVFDRFHQARETQQGTTRGSGVGLALTRELVTLHGGEISARSEGGACFTIRLGLVPAEPLEEEMQSGGDGERAGPSVVEEEEEQTGEAGRRTEQALLRDTPGPHEVLLVDDHPEMRRFLSEALESDFVIRTAEDGKAGFEQALESPPDLIVSDVMMPRLSGLELCRKLRQDERTSHIPIILLTAKADRPSRIEGLQEGADAYLTKPFSRSELSTRIRNLIGQREQLRKKFARRIRLDPQDIAITTTDEQFLRRVMQIIQEQMTDSDFGVANLADRVGLSRVQLHRKLRALTGEPPSDFIRTTRLRLAARLLARGDLNVTQVTYEVGFNNLSYFAKCFRARFGMSPSSYANNPTDEVGQ